MNSRIAFVIVQYKQDVSSLVAKLTGYPVYVIDNSLHNRGYGAAANSGLKNAYANGADWAVVLNQDVIVRSVQSLVNELQSSAACIAGPYAGALDKNRWTTIFPSKQVDYISGSCIAIHNDVYKKIGGFFEPYFMYYEDVDLCVRAKNAGFLLKKLGENGILHRDATVDHEWYLARNHLLFVVRLAPVLVKLYELFRLPKTLGEYLVHRI